MVKQCKECGERHNTERSHCPKCGRAMVRQDRDRIYGWGCGNQWHIGCSFWIPNDPRWSKAGSRSGFVERKYCLECHGFVSHHFWIYDEETQKWGKRRQGDWFCVKCFGPLPEGRENVQKDTPLLNCPARLA